MIEEGAVIERRGTSRPKNILWIQTDEQRTDSVGSYGDGICHTPVIDSLAERGTLFANHFVQSPVCVPSRVCELTSRYPHQTGVLDNSVHYTWGKWPEGRITFPELFAQAGYVTANFGKYHTPHHHTWLENWHFEWFREEAGHMFLGSAFDEADHEVIHLGREPNSVILSGRYPFVRGGRTPQTHVVDTAIDWLRLYEHVRRPFLLRVSFLAPHTPVLAPEPFYSMYDPSEMRWDMPDEDVLESRPGYELGQGKINRYLSHSLGDLQRMRSTYYGLVSHVDEQAGRLLAELDRLGLADDTIIVYTSDHGDLMGEYGQFQKGMFYDLTTRVPCLLAGANIPAGERVERLTEAVDLAPTLLNLAGIPVPDEMEGRDLFSGSPRDDVIGEICGTRDGLLARRSWIRTSRWSMDYTSELGGVPTESLESRDGKLIDLQNDPLAHENLYYDGEHEDIVARLTARFMERTSRDRRPVQSGGPRAW